MNKEILDKYKNKIEQLNEKYIKENDDDIYCKDEETYHIEFDEILTNLLKELGYDEIAKLYNDAHEFFWYA